MEPNTVEKRGEQCSGHYGSLWGHLTLKPSKPLPWTQQKQSHKMQRVVRKLTNTVSRAQVYAYIFFLLRFPPTLYILPRSYSHTNPNHMFAHFILITKRFAGATEAFKPENFVFCFFVFLQIHFINIFQLLLFFLSVQSLQFLL